MKKIDLKNKNIYYGGYQAIITAVVIAIAIIFNFVISGLNLHMDLTEEKFYSLSDKTKEIVSHLDAPVTAYVLEQTGVETDAFKEILGRYGKLSGNFQTEYKDPELYPQFTKQFIDDKNPSIATGSIIIQNTETQKYKVLTQNDLYDINYSQYGEASVNSLKLENAVTSAISYVTSAVDHSLYITNTHGEMTLPSSLTDAFENANLTSNHINLLTDELGEVATSTLLIYAPTKDFDDAEVNKIISFLDAGGKAMIFVDYTMPKLTNFSKILDHYGVSYETGIVVENGASNVHPSSPIYLLPNLLKHDITSGLTKSNSVLLIPAATGLRISDTMRKAVTVTPLLQTTEDSYLKTDLQATELTKTDTDIAGPIDLAYAIEEETYTASSDEPQLTRLFVMADTMFLDNTQLNLSATSNINLVTNAITWLQNDVNTSFEIGGKSFTDYSLPAITTTHLVLFGGLAIIIIPLIIVIAGISVWLRRKNL